MSHSTERLTASLADRYRILRQLGQGGMATVYLAEDLKHDRQVAIKVLKPDLAAVLGAERFVVEIKTTASLSHPHILPLFDSGAADGFLFYVMPYIEGETLRDKLNREAQLSVEEAVRITTEVADALDYAHRRGVIHRDIKPENILLHDGRPMVADFGIALAVSAAAGGRMTETGLSLGTPHYMSPEQATADKEISARSDVYSLASVCYEMLAGQPPHVGSTAQQIIMKIIAEEAQPVTVLRKSVPPHITLTLLKALQKVPADRFASAKEFREALLNPASAATLGTGLQATLVHSGARGPQRRTLALAGGLAVVATIAAVAGWVRPKPEGEVLRFAVSFADSLPLTNTDGTRIALSPDGRTLAYPVGARGPTSRIWVRQLNELEGRGLAGTERAFNLSFSPDGRRIAFVTGAGRRSLRVVSVDGGPITTLTDSLVDNGGVSWGQDGYIYYDGHLEGDGVARVRETGGTPEVATTPKTGETWHNAPWGLPNGRGVLYTARDLAGGFAIGVRDAKSGEHRTLMRGIRAAYSGSGHLLVVTEDGQLLAAPFDLKSLELTGEAQVVAEGVDRPSGFRADIAISSNGHLAYVAGSSGTQTRIPLWVTRRGERSLVDPNWRAEVSGRLSLSPDGRRLAVAAGDGSERAVWIKEMDNGPATRLVERGYNPTWSPDGKTIYYTGPNGLASVSAAGGSSPVALTRAGSRSVVSPDGEQIVVEIGADLFVMRLRGDTAIRPLVTDPENQTLPSISPDGRSIAYASVETGDWQVYVRPFPDASTAKRQISVARGYAPRWSRSGRELFFVTTDSFYVSTVGQDGSIGTAPPKALFAVDGLAVADPFDVSPDGSRFLFLGTGANEAERSRVQLVYVQNFAAELRRRFAGAP